MTEALARFAHRRCQCGHERQHHLDGARCQIVGCLCEKYDAPRVTREPTPSPVPEAQLFEVEL